MLEKYEIVRAMFHGFNYDQQRLSVMAQAIDWVLTMHQAEAAKETTPEGKKRAHRRYGDAVLALSKAFALSAASDAAREIRDEVGFFQAIRAAMIKTIESGKKSPAERELAIQQIVSRAVVSTEIVDIMKAAGIECPDISILSDDFLAEVRGMDKKNLALEALRKLINGEIRSQSKRNVVQSKAFSERLEAAGCLPTCGRPVAQAVALPPRSANSSPNSPRCAKKFPD
jgi:type I restriction enzyme R subunit